MKRSLKQIVDYLLYSCIAERFKNQSVGTSMYLRNLLKNTVLYYIRRL